MQPCAASGNIMSRRRRFLSEGDTFKSSPALQTTTQMHYNLKVFYIGCSFKKKTNPKNLCWLALYLCYTNAAAQIEVGKIALSDPTGKM